MCSATMGNLAPVLMGGLSAVQNISSQKAQIAQQEAEQAAYVQQKNTEWEIAKLQADDEAAARNAAATINLMQLQHREQEINASAVAEKMDINMSARKAKALAKLGAMEAGASGITADRLVMSVDQEASQRLANIETTREHQVGAVRTDKLATINQANAKPIYRNPIQTQSAGSVNYGLAALSGLNAGLSNFNWSSLASGTKSTSSSNSAYCGLGDRFVGYTKF